MHCLVGELNEYADKLGEADSFRETGKLIRLIQESWHCLLNNGIRYSRPRSANQIRGDRNPFAVAVLATLERDRELPNSGHGSEDPDDEQTDETKAIPLNFTALCQLRDSLSISNLLKPAADESLSWVYLIYETARDLGSVIHNYDDEFRAAFVGLERLSASIQGECFPFFQQNASFAKAYVLRQLLTGDGTQTLLHWDNPVAIVALECNWGHDLATPMKAHSNVTLKRLREMHLQAHKGLDATGWICLALEVMGAGVHYEHELKGILRVCKRQAIQIDETRVRQAFEACVKEYDKRMDFVAQDKQSKYDYLEGIHGYEVAYDLLYVKPDETKPPESNLVPDVDETAELRNG